MLLEFHLNLALTYGGMGNSGFSCLKSLSYPKRKHFSCKCRLLEHLETKQLTKSEFNMVIKHPLEVEVDYYSQVRATID